MSESDDALEKIKQAVAEDRVVTPLPQSEDDILVRDGEATLSLVREYASLGDGVFGLCLSDGGGFSSVIVTTTEWMQMRAKVDAFLGLDKLKQ